MSQDIKLKIGADTGELEKNFIASVKKIQSEADKIKISPASKQAASGQGSPGYQTFNQAYQATRAQENKNRTDQQAAQIAKRSLEDVARQLAINSRIAASDLKTDKEKNFYAAERNKLEKEYQTLLATNKRLTQNAAPSGKQGTVPGLPKGGITNLSGLASFVGAPGAIMAIATTALAATKAVEGARRFISEAPLRARENEASAFNMQGQGGQRLQSFFNGGAPEEMMFNKERVQAQSYAEQATKARYSSTGGLASAFSGIDMGYSRAVLGKDAYGAIMHGNIAQGLRAIGGRLGSESLQKEFESQKQIQQNELQQSQFEAIKNGPEGKIRTTVGNKYIKDYQRNLDFERQMGQSEEGFRGFLGNVNRAGFTDEQGMNAASGIMGAGGSTRSAKGNADFVLQMQRQFGLTNAGQAVGKISSQLGSSELSKDALIKIQAEGTRIGVNQADFVEENRKFVEMAAGVVGQSNATSGAGVDQVLSTLTKFMSGANTVSGLEAGKSAYEAYQRQSNTQTGPSAVMRIAGMRKDSVLGQLNERDRAKLSMMPESEITTDSKVIQEMAERKGLNPQALVDNYHKIIGKSLFVNQATDESISKLKQKQKNMQGPLSSGKAYGKQFHELDMAEGLAAGEISIEGAGAGLSEKARLQYARSQAAGDYKGMAKLQEDLKKEAESNKSVRPGDETNKQQAEASRMANEMFTSLQKTILPAAEETAKFTARINDLVAAMSGGNASKIKSAMDALGANAPGAPLTPSDQTHAGTGGAPGR